MGRSVLPHSEATVVAYDHLEPDEEYYKSRFEDDHEGVEEEDLPDFETWMFQEYAVDSEFEWESYVEGITSHIKELFPSMEEADRWEGRENHVIAENAHSEISISEYCGAVAVSLAPRSDFDYYYGEEISAANLGEAWRKRVEEKFLKAFGGMQKIGTFSDGTNVYQKIS